MKAEVLRKSILQMAIQGKLVPQNSSDEPASVLLQKIRAEKEKLIKEGKIKRDKTDSVIFKGEDGKFYEKTGKEVKDITDQLSFEIPDSWVWCRLGEICEYIHRGKSPKYGTEKRLPIIAQKCNQWDKICVDKCLFADISTIPNYKEENYVRVGDILVNSTGTGTVGRTGIVNERIFDNYKSYVVDSHVTIIRTIAQIRGKYIYLYLKSPTIQKNIEDKCSGSTNQIELATITICNYFVPLPPLEEQKRIVEAIEKFEPLLSEYDKLEQQAEKLDGEIFDKLKKSILQYAIQGKLVPQDSSDEPASVLLSKIKAEKEKLIKEGKIKKEKPHPPITDSEKPFDIPDSWQWVRLGEVSILNPKNDISDYMEVSFVPMCLVKDGYSNHHDFERKKWSEIKNGFTHFANGDIGVAKITPCFQNRKSVIFKNLINGYGAGTTELSVVRTVNNTIDAAFLLMLFKSDYFIINGVKSFTGTAGQQRIHKDYIKNFLVPLPPLNEQKRIVARIESIFAEIDKMEPNCKG